MRLSQGARLGPYEVIALLGAGGMGEVYRARDHRIGREVALKILPEALSVSADRVRRFEQEARAAGVLNHPNLVVVHDVGTEGDTPYIVTELLDGRTLREALEEGQLPARRAIEYALSIAAGLAAAHDKGIVHRDLKPENIFITADDRVKLLDFGLAKLFLDDETSGTLSPTVPKQTDPGVVMGTLGYMSPEQLRGVDVDQRSDIFSFGVVLAEMLGGSHPFRRDSAAETTSAILTSDPALPESVPESMGRILRHILEKQPSRRFQTMKDVAFALEMVSGSTETAATPKAKRRAPSKSERTAEEISFQRLTFRRGFVMNARFAPDGSIVYGAKWDQDQLEIYAAHPGTPESRPLMLPGHDVLAVSPSGELALSLGRRFVAAWATMGTLARRPLIGGAPRPLCEGVQDAEWGPDGKTLAIIRQVGEGFSIEYPIGTVILRSDNWISNLRFSPKGDRIAFIDHPFWGDDAGAVKVIDLLGNTITSSATIYPSSAGLAWTPKGNEVLVAGERRGRGRDLVAVSMTGKERTVLAVPSRATLYDTNGRGEVLISFDSSRREIVAGTRSGGNERSLAWFDWSFLSDLSRDGSTILFEEQGLARQGERQSIYQRSIDGSMPVYLGDGRVRAMSHDGAWVVADTVDGNLEMIPTGVGSSRRITLDRVLQLVWWYWLPDGKRLLVWGNEPARGSRIWEVQIDSGATRAIGPEGTGWRLAIAPDGRHVASRGPEGGVMIYAIDSESENRLSGSKGGDTPLQWSADGKSIFVVRTSGLNVPVDRIDVESGEREEWLLLQPDDAAGVLDLMPIMMAADGETYAIGYRRLLSELYVVSGAL